MKGTYSRKACARHGLSILAMAAGMVTAGTAFAQDVPQTDPAEDTDVQANGQAAGQGEALHFRADQPAQIGCRPLAARALERRPQAGHDAGDEQDESPR